MKKAKIMLSAIAVIAVVGGTVAFKVKSSANVWCKEKIGTPQVTCTIKDYTTQFVIGADFTNNPCPEEAVFYTENLCNTIHPETTVYVTER